jgi:hypothetical protein
MKRMQIAVLAAALTLGTTPSWAKIPPPPPPDEKAKAAAEEKKAKDAVAAEKTKADQAAAEDKAVKSFQTNMKKAGKPIPKPTPVATAAPSQPMPPPAGGKATPTPGSSAAAGAVNAKGHEKGAMTPAGNTPPKGTDTPADAKKK